MPPSISPNSFDHVALWVDERHTLSNFLCGHLGMHEIDNTDTFTLAGVDAKEGKLTLFDAEGPREPGVLSRVVLRVGDLDAALERLPDDLEVERDDGVASFQAPGGLSVGLVQAGGLEYDLDHVVLRVPEPEQTAEGLTRLGFEGSDGRVSVADRHLRFEAADPGTPERPLLNHLALLVDSVDEVKAEAERQGIEIIKVVDAANTIAVFVMGPDGIQVEYVEHKPGFALV